MNKSSTLTMVLAITLASTSAHADDAPTPTQTPTTPTAPSTPTPPPAPDSTNPPTPELTPTPEPTPTPPTPTPPPPTPAPMVPTTTTANGTTTSSSPAPVAAVTKTPRVDDYYSRQRGLGMFHKSRLVVGALSGEALPFTDGMPGATLASTTRFSLGVDGVFLAMPSSFGNFHGIEFSSGVRTSPFDFWLSGGTAVTLLNIGKGGPGSLRIGGGFGMGFNLAHGYGYVRGRAALVIVPMKLDVEVSAQWSPPAASTNNYDEQTMRASAWYRPSKSQRAYEVFIETYHRIDDTAMTDKEFENGVGGGVGLTLF